MLGAAATEDVNMDMTGGSSFLDFLAFVFKLGVTCISGSFCFVQRSVFLISEESQWQCLKKK